MSHDVFLSHSSQDVTMANAVCAALEQAKIKCWMAPRDILPGDSWGASIVDAIENSEVMVIIFSANSNSSKQVTREVERAVQKDVVVVPFKIDSVSPSRDMEYFLSSTHWLDAVSPETEKHLSELCSIINSILKRPSTTQTQPAQSNASVANTNNNAAHHSENVAASEPVTDTAALFNQSKNSETKSGLSSKLVAAAVAVLFLAIGGTWFLTKKNNGYEDLNNVNENAVVEKAPAKTPVVAEPDQNTSQQSTGNSTEDSTEKVEEPSVETTLQPNSESVESTTLTESQPEPEPEPIVETTAEPALIQNALNTCDDHVANKRLTTGEGGNAVDCYNEVLQLDPDNQRAKAGLLNIETQYANLIKKAIKDSRKPRAERYLKRLKKVNPSSAQIADLENQIDDLDATVVADNTESSSENSSSSSNTTIPTLETGYWSNLPFFDRTKALSLYASAYSIEKSGSVTEAPKAVSMYQKVAKLGYDKAQFRLAGMIENGRGTKADSRLALAWYIQASIQGHAKAQSAVTRVKKNLGLN